MSKKRNDQVQSVANALSARKIYLIILVFSFLLYGNTIKNDYGFDDEYVARNNTQVQGGIKALPEIFSTYYTAGSNTKGLYGYRPIIKASFAIEYSLFGANPHISHFFNVLLYAFCGILVFVLLANWMRKYTLIFPLLIILIFLAHPIHTEVVASLKNRDVLFSFLGGMGLLYFVVKYFEGGNIFNLVWAFLASVFAFFSKPDTQPYLLMIPFAGYFFTDSSIKKSIWAFVSLGCALTAIFFLVNAWLPVMGRSNGEIDFFENPLFFETDWLVRIGTSFNSLLTYLRMSIYPSPLLCYYGYNTIPVESIFNFRPLFSLVIHTAAGIYAILSFKKKNILAFGIIWYLAHVSIFSNLIAPAVGIVAERFVFGASLGFSIVLGYLIMKLSKINIETQLKSMPANLVFKFSAGIVLLLFSIQTISRNNDWKDPLTLFRNDIKCVDNSVKMNEVMGAELIKLASKKSDKQEREQLVLEAIKYYNQAIEIYPKYSMGYNNIGTFYANIFNDCEKAVPFFRKAIESDTAFAEARINLGLCDARLGKNGEAIEMLELGMKKLPGKFLVSYTTLLALYFEKGDEQTAKKIMNSAIIFFPDSEVPYREMAMQYLEKKDTLEAINYFEPALKIKADPQLSKFIYQFLMKEGERERAERFNLK